MEAICSTWEKPLVIGEDALNFGGGRTDEFLKQRKGWPGCKELWRRKGESTLVYL